MYFHLKHMTRKYRRVWFSSLINLINSLNKTFLYIYFESVSHYLYHSLFSISKCNIWCIHQITVVIFNWLQINGTRFWKTGTRQIIKEFSNCKLMISCKFHFCKVIRETTYHFTIIYMSCLFTQRLITYFAISLNK